MHFITMNKASLQRGCSDLIPLNGMTRWLALSNCNVYWAVPHTGTETAGIPASTLYLLCEMADGSYLVMLPMISGDMKATLRGTDGGVIVDVQGALPGTEPKDAAMLCIAEGNNPYTLSHDAVAAFQKRNGLTADGIAGVQTQTKLYSGNCVTGDTALPEDNSGSGGVTGNGGGPAVSQVKLLHWFDDIKPTIKSGQVVLVYEPSSNSSFYLRFYSLGRHADSEPLTAQDTAIMKAAWGGKFSWSEKPVYVRLPNGTWCIASMHSMPHLSGSISDNDFDGHLCVHFPRTMTECQQNDPKNGVRHQNDIRKHWLKITGEEIPW